MNFLMKLFALVLGISGLFILAVSIGYNVYIKKEKEITFKEYLKLMCLDRESLVEFFKPVISAGKSAGKLVNNYLKAHRVGFDFDADGGMLWSRFFGIIEDYMHMGFEYEFNYVTSQFPSYIYAKFYTKHKLTDEIRQEILFLFCSAVSDYLNNYELSFELFPTCDVTGNFVYVKIYYCEFSDEVVSFKNWVHNNIQYELGGNHGILEEKNIVGLKKDDKVFLGVDCDKYQFSGFLSPKYWDITADPHGLIAGPTGGGKTILALSIVKQLLERRADVIICDYKSGGDWDGILPPSRYAVYKDCDRLFDDFYKSFEETQADGVKRERYLIFDEMSAWLLNKNNKDYKESIEKLSTIAFLGRSFGFHILCIAQQPNAAVLPTAIRDQLGLKIHMGQKISRETAGMMFPSCEIDKNSALEKYCGYISTQDSNLEILQTPRLSDPARLRLDLIELGKQYKD